MKGEHYHEWKYNEVVCERIIGKPISRDESIENAFIDKCSVIRFCTQCLKVENIDLKV